MVPRRRLGDLISRLTGSAEEMGAVLVRSAHSANIKERRDASTALFTALLSGSTPVRRCTIAPAASAADAPAASFAMRFAVAGATTTRSVACSTRSA